MNFVKMVLTQDEIESLRKIADLLGPLGLYDYAFIAFGKASYRTLLTHGGATVAVPAVLERPLQSTLQVESLFKAICAAKRHATPNMHAVFALALSRYMLDNEWVTLIAP
jgi:hypothetical protein